MQAKVIAIDNQKGRVVKTTTCTNLGIGFARAGKKVLLIDADPQGSLSISLGNSQPDKLPFTLSQAMERIIMEKPILPGEGILHHFEGVDLLPANCTAAPMLRILAPMTHSWKPQKQRARFERRTDGIGGVVKGYCESTRYLL